MSGETDKTINDEDKGLPALVKLIAALTWLPETDGSADAFASIEGAASAAIAEATGALAEPAMDVSDLVERMQQSALDSTAFETLWELTMRAMLTDQQRAIFSGAEPHPIDNPLPPLMTSTDYPVDYDPYADPAFQALVDILSLATATDVSILEDALSHMKENGRAQGESVGVAQGQAEGLVQGRYEARAQANDYFAQQYATATDMFSSDNFYSAYDKTGLFGEFSDLKNQHTTSTNIFKSDLDNSVTAFNIRVAAEYDDLRAALARLHKGIEGLAYVQRSAMQAYGTQQTTALTTAFAQQKELIQDIATKIGAFNPLRHITENQEVFSEYATRFRDNVSGIQGEVSEQVTHDNAQLSQLYQDNAQYITELKENIQAAKGEGDTLLAQALEVFYVAKTGTSASNVENMEAFAGKMPNSSIGSLGNNNLYNFMASPIQSIDSDPLARPALPQEIQRVGFLQGKTILYILIGTALGLLLMIASFFTASALHDYHARKRYEEDLAISAETAYEI